MDAVETSPFQDRVLAIPEQFDLFLGGGRGGSKSQTMAFIALRHATQYGERARILYLRKSYKGLADFENLTRELFGALYGTTARYNQSEHVWRLPGGAYFELGQLDDASDYSKYQGRSFTLILIDEAGHFASPELLDRLRSNLRAPAGIPLRMVMAANPGDPGHFWLASRFVFRAAPWVPFYEEKSGRDWIHAPSTFLDNPYIDQDDYKKQLASSCPTDPELLRAWLTGDWAVCRGAYFAGVLDEKRNAIDPWPEIPRGWLTNEAEVFLSHDFGVSAPSVTYVCVKSPGMAGPDGRYFPRGSIILVDELASNEPGSMTKGLGWTVPVLAEGIRELAARWKMKRAEGVADDAIFSNTGSSAGSISDEFRRAGVFFIQARKGSRVAGWEKMRRLLQDAGKPDLPGLFISRACQYFWSSVPYLGRDPKRADDVDSRGPDHGADAARYALVYERPTLVPFALMG